MTVPGVDQDSKIDAAGGMIWICVFFKRVGEKYLDFLEYIDINRIK